MCIVGCEETPKYSELINALKLKNVCFIPHCSFEKLQNFYRAADVFALATHSDTWGLVINEAMACGLPVVTTHMCIAGQQLIRDEENGFLVPAGSVAPLAEALGKILENSELAYAMRCNNLKKIQDYSLENMTDSIFRSLSGDPVR